MSEAPVLVEGPLTPDLVARAVVASATLLGFDPATVFERVKDGRGRVRHLAAAVLVHPACRPPKACGRILHINANDLAPSGLQKRGILAHQIADVRATVFASPIPPGPDIVEPGDAPAMGPGWVNPRRDLEREARVVALREKGVGPAEISAAEGIGVTAVHRILNRSGKTFESLKPGPRGPRAKAAPRAKARAPKLEAAPPPTPQSPPPVTPFPRDHAVWAPLPGSAPVRLIDHKKGCRWPVEVEGASDPMVCDLKPHPGHAYCGRHRWLSLSPTARSGETKTPAALPVRVARSADADVAALKEEAA